MTRIRECVWIVAHTLAEVSRPTVDVPVSDALNKHLASVDVVDSKVLVAPETRQLSVFTESSASPWIVMGTGCKDGETTLGS